MPANAKQPRRAYLIAGPLLYLVFFFAGNLLATGLQLPVLRFSFQFLGVAAITICLLLGHDLIKRANLRLRLSDLFWLMLVLGVGIGWIAERIPLARELRTMEGYPSYPFLLNLPNPAAAKRQAILQELRSLSDDELRQRMQNAGNWWGDDEFDGCLAELTRRGDSDALRLQHQQMYDKSLREFGGFETWPALTALRRSQQQPAPLKVGVQLPHALNTRPLLIVTLQNVDVEGQPVVFQEVGMQRHGREEQFRVYLTDEAGRFVPNSNLELVHRRTHGFSNKISYSTRIQAGKTNASPYILDLRKYVAPPPTGRYQLHVVFSDSHIADEENLEAYTLCRSDPLDVWVENRAKPPRVVFSVYPVFMLLLLAAAAVGYSLVQRLRREADQPQPLHRIVDWRALIAITLAFFLAGGWLLDVRKLAAEIDRFRPHDQADWSIVQAQ